MHSRPWFRLRGHRKPHRFASAVTSVATLAVLAGLAVQPGSVRLNAEPVSDSYPWYEDTAAEQLRQDQCLMGEVLRLGGPSMAAVAQDGLNQPSDRLHVLANREHWEKTPLAGAYDSDRAAAHKQMDDLDARQEAWEKPLSGLAQPGNVGDEDFYWPPGTANDGKQTFYERTGLSAWVADRFWKDDSDFYEDSTPEVDAKTLQAVDDRGNPLYGKDPVWSTGTAQEEWERALAEHSAFQWMHGGPATNAGADDARIFLSSGGFPRTVPQQGTAEYRVAVEDLKTRFASCAWRDPLDPDRVLDGVTAAAADEWQQEISSQAAQRNQIVSASKDATDALAKGAKALSEMLGQSWVADHLTRWQDYWSAGDLGYIGDAPLVIQIPGATGKCLEVQGGGKTDGTPVQVSSCNGGAAQEWTPYNDGLSNVNSHKCLEVANGSSANGAKVQIHACDSSKANRWKFDVRHAGPLVNEVTGKCLHLLTFNNGSDAIQSACNGSAAQNFRIVPKGHTGDGKLGYPDTAQFTKAKAGLAAAQAAAKSQLSVLKAQLAAGQKAATSSDTALQAAYGITDAAGAPRGRGLLVGLQKDQVTKGAA
ncbi:virulence factor, partial [Streptomyces sp. SID486]|nr:virulence factor [Streptomyces sp. SID486]